MVVDDNTATRRMVRSALQRNGHEVIEAVDGRSARELMREQPRVVLQDLMLPDVDGFELVGQLRDLATSEISILAFSGFVSKLDEARVSTVGFDDIIPKPIAPSRLVPLIEAYLPSMIPNGARFGVGRRLVIADDDPMQLKLAAFRLGRIGFSVEIAPDGAAALEAIRRQRPDAVVSDVMMPELDGFGLAMALRQDPALRSLPLVLVTSSYVEKSDRELARRSGANDLVLRTPELSEVIDTLRATLAAADAPPEIQPEALPDLERERNRRVFRQLERQVMLNTGLAKRCSALASELTVLTGIADAVLKHRDVDVALDESLASCFDAGGVAVGALYLLDEGGKLRVREVGSDAAWDDDDLETFFGREALLRSVIASGKQLYLPSDEVDRDVADDLMHKCGASSLLVMPLVSSGTQLGALLMVARGRDVDQDDWRAFAIGVGTQISQVLTLAKAYADRAAAERRAAQQAALLEAVVDSAPDLILDIDLNGTIRFANRAVRGVPPDQAVGTSFFDQMPSDQLRTVRAAFDLVVATGKPAGYELQGLSGDSAQSTFSVRLCPVKEDDRVIGVIAIARDVTEKKATEMQLMLADRMASVGTLAAGVAHEINNPLASVIANLDMAILEVDQLGERVELPADLAEELSDALTSAGRVREIVRDLKIFSRAQEDHRGPVDVERVLESTLRMAWNELRHRARVVKQFAEVPPVEGNESRLGQVFLNLIVNAAQAIPEGNYQGNQIKIETALENGTVSVVIRDTGCGIPLDVQPRLFTPFFTTKPVGVGTGLGLAISHRIITSMGGEITFETEVGKGTLFKVTLPVTQTVKPVVSRTKSPLPPALRRGRVLVIDDEEPLAQALRRFLSVDHEVDAVTSARTALDGIRRGERYDVILCDLMMPQVTGMDFHAAVLELDPKQAAKIVFVTGGAFTAAARQFLDSTRNRRLEKPFDLKALGNLVNEMLV